jgi:hypothetical protein
MDYFCFGSRAMTELGKWICIFLLGQLLSLLNRFLATLTIQTKVMRREKSNNSQSRGLFGLPGIFVQGGYLKVKSGSLKARSLS